ncbi:MAG: tyrosine-type recombinase/integrase [Verrucomicrobiota bacterium]
MASVHRDPRNRSPYWTAAFTGPDGRRLKKSTKSKDRLTAQRIADGWEEASAKLREGELIESQARQVFDSMLRDSGEPELSLVTVRMFLEEILSVKSKSASKATLSKYSGIFRDFLEFLGGDADKRIDRIKPLHIERFLDADQAEGRSASTVNLRLNILGIAFNRAWKLGVIPVNPVNTVDRRRGSSESRELFSDEQIRKILAAADHSWKGMILLGRYCGLRISDAANLTWENITDDWIVYTPAKTAGRRSKRDEQLEVPISGSLREYFDEWPRERTGPLFPELHHLPRAATLSRWFMVLVKQVGIDPYDGEKQRIGKGKRTPKYSFHSLRHGFVSALADSGVSEELRMALTGHKSRAVHMGYTHRERDTLKAAVEKLPKL